MKNLLINRALAAKKKKLFSLFLALVASVGTMFASDIQVDGIWYDFDRSSKTATVTYRGYSYSYYSNEYTGDIVIPASVTYNSVSYSVTSIGGRAFYQCSGLTSIEIPNSVTSIGNYAFSGCIGLTSIEIPNSVTSIEDYAFSGCEGLTSVNIPNSVTSIGKYAFAYCHGLTSVTIPNSVTGIGDYAFTDCSSLTSINVASDNSNYCSVDGVLFNKDKTTLIQYPGGKQGAYTIPNSVTSIGSSAFSGCIGLTSVTIGNSVTSIGDYAFYNCTGLTSIEIPNSVTSIGNSAFDLCSGLTSVTIPDSVTSIGNSAFGQCSSLISVTIPNSVTSIGDWAFIDCSGLISVTIGNSVTSIGNSAFSCCYGLTSVTIPNSVTSIGSRAFYNCSGLTTVTIEAETPPTLEGYDEFVGDYPIYVPCNAVYTYKTASEWHIYAERIYVNPDCPNITVRLDPSSCSGWSTVRLWAWTANGNLFDSWPGRAVGKDIDGWYFYTFDEDITSVNIIWNNGTNQTVDIEGVTSSTCYALNSTIGTTITARVVDCVTGQTLGHANESTTTAVTATPNEDNSVTLTWPAVNGADTYTIEIKKNGVSVCTLVFNANGQLISINFAAPARDGKGRNISAEDQSANGWTYVVTGLEENASYTYSVTAKDVNGNVLLKQSVDFSMGEELTSIEDVLSDQVQNTKLLRNGQIFILRGDKTYTLQGQETIMP